MAYRTVATLEEPVEANPHPPILPDVELQQPAVKQLGSAREQLDCFGSLKRRNDCHRGKNHSGCIACGRRARRRYRLEEAAQASGQPRTDRHRGAASTHYRAINPWNAELGAHVVEQVSGLEVVGRIQDEVDPLDKSLDRQRVHVLHDPLDVHFRVYLADPTLGGNRLGYAFFGIPFGIEDLSVEV